MKSRQINTPREPKLPKFDPDRLKLTNHAIERYVQRIMQRPDIQIIDPMRRYVAAIITDGQCKWDPDNNTWIYSYLDQRVVVSRDGQVVTIFIDGQD